MITSCPFRLPSSTDHGRAFRGNSAAGLHAVVCALTVAIATDALAQSRTWVNISSGNLLTNSNWSSNAAPNAVGATAIFNTNPTSLGNFTLNGSMTLGTLTYNNIEGRQLNGTGTLRFETTSGNALFHTTASSGYLDPNVAGIVLADTTEFRIQGNNTVDMLSPISGSGALIKSGAQRLNLNDNNSYTGNTDVSGSGALRLQHTNALGSTAGFTQILGANGGHTGRLELAGGLSFAAEPLRLRGRSATVTEAHLVNVSGNNTWNGPITLYTDASTYTIESAASTLTLSSTATISPGNATGNRTIHLRGAGNGIANGVISDGADEANTYHITKSGAGTWTLAGVNSYDGTTTISGGTLRGSFITAHGVNSNFGRGHFTISNLATLQYTGPSSFANRNIALIDNGGVIDVSSAATTLTLTGVISGAANLLVSGAGTLQLSGNNTYLGTTLITQGNLQLGANERIPDQSEVVLFLPDASLNLNGKTETIGALSGLGDVSFGDGSLGVGHLITGANGIDGEFSGSISGIGRITKTGAGVFLIGGNNSYTGSTTISEGTLRLAASERIPNSSAVTVSAAVLDLNNFTETIGSLSGSAGTIELGGGRLITSSSSSTTFTGEIRGTGGLTKRGLGTLSLNAASSYTGSTVVEQGELRLSGSSNALSVSSLIDVRAGAILHRTGGNLVVNGLTDQSLEIHPGGEVAVEPGFSLQNRGIIINDGLITTDLFWNTTAQDGGPYLGNGTIQGEVLNTGTFMGDGTILGNLSNERILNPGGDLTGILTIDGQFTQDPGPFGAVLRLGIGGVTPVTDFDVVDISGSATLAGVLQIVLLNGFQPVPESTFTILESSGIVGQFENVPSGARLTTADGSGSFKVHYGAGSSTDPTQIVLSDFRLAGPSIEGDFNSDGLVDTADYVVWRQGLGTIYTAEDYSTWSANFGAGTTEWTNSSGGSFENPANWSAGSPNFRSKVVLPQATTTPITLAASYEFTALEVIADGAVALDLAGHELDVNGTVRVMPAAGAGPPKLELIGGSFTASNLSIYDGAKVLVTSGSSVTVHDTLSLIGSAASLIVEGDVNAQNVVVATASQVTQSGGTLTADEVLLQESSNYQLQGGTLRAETLNISFGRFQLDAGTLHVDEIFGGLVQDGGSLAVGPNIDGAVGQMIIYFDEYILNDGVVEIDIAGFNSSDQILAQFSPGITLNGGSLVVSITNPNYDPAPGHVFDVLDVGDAILDGQFADLILPELAPGLAWDVQYDSFRVRLQVISVGAGLAQVPEPGTATLALSTAALVLASRRSLRCRKLEWSAPLFVVTSLRRAIGASVVVRQ